MEAIEKDDRKEHVSHIKPRLTAEDQKAVEEIEGDGGKAYRALGVGGVQYAGPSPKGLPPHPPHPDSTPHFIGPDGTLYNAMYQAVDQEVAEGEGHFSPNNEAFRTLPSPEAFMTFQEYDAAMMQWKLEFSRALGNAQLPTVLGSVYYRPFVGSVNIASELELSEQITDASEDGTDADELKRSKGSASATPTRSAEELTEGDVDDSDMFDRRWLVERDRWDSVLIPCEPNPAHYSSYGLFEAAMMNWARLCSKSVLLPPSTAQMERVLGFTLAGEEEEEDEGLRVSTVLLSHGAEDLGEDVIFAPRTNLLWFSDSDDEMLSNFEVKRRPCPIPNFNVADVAHDGIEVSEEVIEKLSETFGQLFEQRKKNFLGKFRAYHAPDICHSHFVTSVSHRPYSGSVSRTDSLTKPIRRGRQSRAENMEPVISTREPLRRSDLTMSDIRAHSDLPTHKDGTVTLVPQTELDHVQVDAIHRGSYRRQLQALLEETYYTSVQACLHSWYHPQSDEDRIGAFRKRGAEMITSSPDPLSMSQIMELFTIGVYLDEFDSVLSEEVPNALSETSYLKELMRTVTPESFPELLGVMNTSNSQLVHATVAHFVTQMIQQGKLGKQLVASVVEKRDFPTLFQLTKAFCLLHNKRVEVFPYDQTLIDSACLTMSEEDRVICKSILLMHYLDAICARMGDNAYMYVSVLEYSKEVRTTEAAHLSSNLENNLEFISNTIFRLMDHRVRRISGFGLFLIIQLMSLVDVKEIVGSIQHEHADFLNKTRTLAKSKKLAAQNAARHIYSHLQSTEVWRVFLWGFYNKYELAIIDDLRSCNRDGSPTVLSDIALSMSLNAIRGLSMLSGEKAHKYLSRMSFVMKGSSSCLFHNLLQLLRKDRKITNSTTASISRVMDGIAVQFRRLDMISGGEGASRPTGVGNNLPVSAHDLMQLVEWAAHLPLDSVERRAARANLVRTARQFCYSSLPFDSMKRELSFYTNLLQICREGDAPDANKEAWKLMYTLIRHHTGVVAWMEGNGKLLNQLLEIVSIGASMTVVRNSLYYIAKILDLVAVESEKVFNNVPNSRGELELKSVEKDVKLVNSFIVSQSKWIKFHMIYKKLSGEGCAGQAFLALVNLFAVIEKHKASKATGADKLYKEISKTPEYLEGIQRVIEMKKGPAPQTRPSRPMSRSISISRVNQVKKN